MAQVKRGAGNPRVCHPRQVRLAASAIAATLMFGCFDTRGGSQRHDAGQPGTPATGAFSATPIAEDVFIKRYVDAVCRAAEPCCEQLGTPVRAGLCDYIEDGIRGDLAEEIGNPRVIYDPDAAGACIARIRRDVEACTLPDTRRDCTGIFVGTVAVGDECFSASAECAGGGSCNYRAEWGMSRCTEGSGGARPNPRPAALGDGCRFSCDDPWGHGADCFPRDNPIEPPSSDDYCRRQDGAYCHPTDWRCVSLKDEDASCEDSLECALNLRCSEGTCRPRLAPPEACVQVVDCEQTATCRESGCVARVPNGGSCASGVACALGAYCSDRGVCETYDPFSRLCTLDHDIAF